MPFTPFHMGPGLLTKAAAPRRVSLVAFGTVQLAIDLETWYYMTNGEAPLHRTLHTFLFGTAFSVAIGALVFVIGWITHRLVAKRTASMSIGTALPLLEPETSAAGVFSGAILGAVTHVILDAIMHGDMHPFAPFTGANPLVGLIKWDPLHLLCIAMGVAGGIWLVANRPIWHANTR
jgi:hypothetical protein